MTIPLPDAGRLWGLHVSNRLDWRAAEGLRGPADQPRAETHPAAEVVGGLWGESFFFCFCWIIFIPQSDSLNIWSFGSRWRFVRIFFLVSGLWQPVERRPHTIFLLLPECHRLQQLLQLLDVSGTVAAEIQTCVTSLVPYCGKLTLT